MLSRLATRKPSSLVARALSTSARPALVAATRAGFSSSKSSAVKLPAFAPFGARMSSHVAGESTVSSGRFDLIHLQRFVVLWKLTLFPRAATQTRPDADQAIQDIADYVHSFKIDSDLAYSTARLCLIGEPCTRPASFLPEPKLTLLYPTQIPLVVDSRDCVSPPNASN